MSPFVTYLWNDARKLGTSTTSNKKYLKAKWVLTFSIISAKLNKTGWPYNGVCICGLQIFTALPDLYCDVALLTACAPSNANTYMLNSCFTATRQSVTILLPHHTSQPFYSFFRDQLGEPVPEENFLTLWCKGRLTEADTSTIRMGATPSGLVTSAHLHHPPYFFTGQLPFLHPTNSVKAPKATSTFGLGRRR